MKTFKIVNEDISDGYHTFNELYEHRNLLFINLCLAHKEKSFWKKDQNTAGWFVLYLETPSGQISYHIQEYFRPLLKDITEDPQHEWDGHKSDDVIFRLRNEALK